MARYEARERMLLLEICQKYPEIVDNRYKGEVLKKRELPGKKLPKISMLPTRGDLHVMSRKVYGE